MHNPEIGLLLLCFLFICQSPTKAAPTNGPSFVFPKATGQSIQEITSPITSRSLFKSGFNAYQVSVRQSDVQPMQAPLAEIMGTAVTLIRMIATSWNQTPAVSPFLGLFTQDERRDGVSIDITVESLADPYSTQLLGYIGMAAMNFLLTETRDSFVPYWLAFDLDYSIKAFPGRYGQIIFTGDLQGSDVTNRSLHETEVKTSNNLSHIEHEIAPFNLPNDLTAKYQSINFHRQSYERRTPVPINTWITLVYKALRDYIWTKHNPLRNLSGESTDRKPTVLSLHGGLGLTFQLLVDGQDSHIFNYGDLHQVLLSMLVDAKTYPPAQSASFFSMINNGGTTVRLPPFLLISVLPAWSSTDLLNQNTTWTEYQGPDDGHNSTDNSGTIDLSQTVQPS